MSDPQVIEAVLEYVNAWAWEDKRAVVESRWSLLLGDDADRVMLHLIVQHADNLDLVASLEEQRTVLARCRQLGIGEAFNPYLHPELDSLDAAVVDRLKGVATEQEFLELIAKNATLRRLLAVALQALLGAPTLAGKRAVLERDRSLLLTPAADYAAMHMAAQSDGDLAAAWAWHREMLSVARDEGIESALGWSISTGSEPQGAVSESYDGYAADEAAGLPPEMQVILSELVSEGPGTDAARVIHLCRDGLHLLNPETQPAVSAFLHEQLGSRLLDDRGTDRGKSVELAIEHFTRARSLTRRLGRPIAEASMLQGLATAFVERRQGSPAENARHAAQLCEEGLELLSEQDPLETSRQRANLHFAAAQAYGSDSQARRHAEAALRLMDRDSRPRDWAAVHLILGRLTCRRDGYQAAMGHFEAVESVFTASDHAEDFAILQDEIANALMSQDGSEPDEAPEVAIKRLDAGLAALSHRRQGHLYAALSMSLGQAYLRRAVGDPADNIEKAIEALETALRGFVPEEFADEWAATQLRLGKAYRRRLVGQATTNLSAAKEAFDLALTVFTRASWPQQWAGTRAELGTVAMLQWAVGAGSLDEAVREFELALDALAKDASPEDWAYAHANLAEVCRLRGKRQPDDRLLSMEHLLRAAEVWTRDEAPAQWSLLQYGTGKLHAQVAYDSDTDYRSALECFRAYLDTARPDDEQRISVLGDVAELQLAAGKWDEALAACREAATFAGKRLGATYTVAARRKIVSHLAHTQEIAAYSLVRQGRAGEGLVCLDGARSKLLLDELTFGIDLGRLDPAQRKDLDRARALVTRLQTEQALPVDYQERRSDAELGRLLAVATSDLSRILERLRSVAGMGEPAEVDVVLAAIPSGEALVEVAITNAGGVVFVVPGGTRQIGPEHLLPVSRDLAHQIDDMAARFLETYCALLLERIGFDQWNEFLADLSRWLWDSLVGSIHSRLVDLGVERDALVTFVPEGRLAMLPLHAAHPGGGSVGSLLDHFAVAYAPSASVLRICRQKAGEPARAGRRVTIVSNPTLDLPNATDEALAVAGVAGNGFVTLLEGASAEREAVKAAIPGATYVHFACHGYNNWRESDFSGIILAGGRPFTSTEIVSTLDLGTARLVTLSACETAVRDVRQANELLGLPAAFLRTGAPGVVATLWSVSDDSTRLLMERFYLGLLRDELSPARALRAAQLWLRGATAEQLGMVGLPPDAQPFSGTHDWGAFVLQGV